MKINAIERLLSLLFFWQTSEVKLNVLKRNLLIQEIDLGKEVLAFDYSETIF